MKKLLVGMAMVAFSAAPVLAFECPLLGKQIDAAVGNRMDDSAASAKVIAGEAAKLHAAGRHAESVAVYAAAAKVAGVELQYKKK
jgi:hypothetical protein